jgi:hypothetical protein
MNEDSSARNINRPYEAGIKKPAGRAEIILCRKVSI